jgi:hypothetical protein
MRLITALLLSTIFTPAIAGNGTCDCSQSLGSCSVSGNRQGSNLTLRGPSNKCVNVTYYTDGYPHSLTLRGSTSVEVNRNAEISIGDDCHVCAEGGQGSGERQLSPAEAKSYACRLSKQSARNFWNKAMAECRDFPDPNECVQLLQQRLENELAQPC